MSKFISPFEVTDDLAWENPEGWTTIQEGRVTYIGRWNHYWRRIIQNTETNELLAIEWSQGNTEMQNCDTDVEVYPVQLITITDYERIG